MDKDTEIFRGKNFSDILKDIYDNTRKKDRQVVQLIADLKPLVGSVQDAMLVVPLISDYLEIAVKNDEHLVKMAAIIQRMLNKSRFEGDDDVIMTEDERRDLMQEYEELAQENNVILEEKKKLQDDIVEATTAEKEIAGENNG